MNLTSAQKAALAAHIAANTNIATYPDGSGEFVINAEALSHDPTAQQAIADWYNGLALAGDNQPFNNLFLWNPVTSIAQLNTAIDWTTNPAGGTAADVANSWLKWQSMCWANFIDMTDAQVRTGVVQVWGAGSTSASGIGSNVNLCGKLQARRIDLVLAGNPVGNLPGTWAGARVVPKGAGGVPIRESMSGNTVVPPQVLTQSDIESALFPNG